jgi:TetR/AcrR family transcriptional regulator
MQELKPGATRKPRQDRSEKTRQRILDEALAQFSERGYESTSVRDIAAAVDGNHSLVTYYFGTKETLWREAVAMMFARQRKELAAPGVDADLDVAERFRRFLQRYVRYSARHPEHSRIIMLETAHANSRIAWAAREIVGPLHQYIQPMMEELVAERILPDVPIYQLIYSIAWMCQAPFIFAREIEPAHGINPNDPAEIEKYVETVIKLIMH